MEPQAFVDAFLAPLHPAAVVVGQNFRFGYRAAGTPGLLANMGLFDVRTVDLAQLDGRPVSSSAIRGALAAGEVAEAAAMLGRDFRVRGVVQTGDQRGRTLGFPTANVPLDPALVAPGDGVYAGWLRRADDPTTRLPAAISVGVNPTFSHVTRHVEANVLDRFDLELYGVDVSVEFVAWLRGMTRFDGVDSLVAQMHRDVDHVKVALGLPA
jgi:riboflavin kinase/FMN adenylyltransferase